MKKIVCSLLAVMLLLTMSGCFGSNAIERKDAPYPVTVGNATVLEQPERVATLSVQFTNILRDLGYEEKIVAAADEEADGNDALTGIGSALVPDIEAIKEVKPELLFTSSSMTTTQLNELWEAGVQVVVLPPVTSLETMYERYYDVIAAMDGKVEANTAGTALVDAMKGDVERLLAKLPEKKATFVFVCTDDPYIATPDTPEGMLLALLGENAVTGETYTAKEKLSDVKADVLLYDAALKEKDITEDKELGGISERTEAFDRASLLCGTKDMIERLRDAAALLYPEIDFTDAAAGSQGEPSDESSEESVPESSEE